MGSLICLIVFLGAMGAVVCIRYLEELRKSGTAAGTPAAVPFWRHWWDALVTRVRPSPKCPAPQPQPAPTPQPTPAPTPPSPAPKNKWQYCPWCKGDLAFGDVDGKHRLKCTKCNFVNWDNPKPVAIALIPFGDKLVLIRRNIEPRIGKIALPGGFVEPYETPEDGAIREVFEETGLKVEIDRLFSISMPTKVNEVLFFYLCKPVTELFPEGPQKVEVQEILPFGKNDPTGDIAFDLHKRAIARYFEEVASRTAAPDKTSIWPAPKGADHITIRGGTVGSASASDFLYPEIEPYRSGRLKVSDLHEIYFEECGNPRGKPVVFVHGGPGGGTNPACRRFFDPAKYRIILFDQRGCGKSTPHASLVDNTTWDLVEDMEKLRKHLGIEKWQVFGGSWGSTLSLAYAQTHRKRVTELVLRGIFLLRKQELDWFYQNGASQLFPDAWESYLAAIPEAERGNLMQAYYKRLTGDDATQKLAAAKAWSIWEGSTSKLFPDDKMTLTRFGDPEFALAFARIEAHYFVNGGFLSHENQLLDNVPAIKDVPCVIVQGRYDVVCPATSAWDLHRAWPEAQFVLVEDAGHSAMEAGIARALVAATDKFAGS